MNPLKLCVLAALAFAAVASAQDAPTTAPPTTAPTSSANATSGDNITVTKNQLDALIADVKAQIASDPDLAAIFDQIDLDALLALSPDQARQALNDYVFNATAPPKKAGSSSNSGSGAGGDVGTTTAPPPSSGGDNVDTKAPAVPGPAPATGAAGASLTAATVTTLATGVVVTVFNL